MQRMKNWELEMPHQAFMAEIRRMSSGTYAAPRETWSNFDHGRLGGREHSGGRPGRPRVVRDHGEGDAR